MMILYHGSNQKIDNDLTPHMCFSNESVVSLTTDMTYALVRCGNFDKTQMLIRESYDGHIYELTELEPNAFERVFNCSGWLYLVAPQNNMGVPRHGEVNEIVSYEPVHWFKRIFISNVLKSIKDIENIKLIFYEQADDEYWSKVTGGKEGYINRRKKRIKKFLKH